MAKVLVTLTTLLYVLSVTVLFLSTANASQGIGVCYGMLGDNLPPALDVINLYLRQDIRNMRLFDPDIPALQALRQSGIRVTVGIKNQELRDLASGLVRVAEWFGVNIAPYLDDVIFDYITVGDGVIPGELGQYVCPVMMFLQEVLNGKGLSGIIKVTTVVPAAALSVSYPPSNGTFSESTIADLRCVLQFLSTQRSPLMVNVYPYFAYASNPTEIRLNYAQFTAIGPVLRDGNLNYSNLFDAMVDAIFAAMEKEGAADVWLVVSESGWPSGGNGKFTTPALARTYNNNFVKHILTGVGTPRRPGTYIDGFVFAMFNENLKPEGVERYFGLFHPSTKPVYPDPVYPPNKGPLIGINMFYLFVSLYTSLSCMRL